MIVVDTSVLLYAVGADHALRKPCRRILELASEGRIVVAVTLEILQEFAHVRARRRSRDDAVSLALNYADACQIVPLERHDLERGLSLFRSRPSLGAFDAVVAAVALNRDVDALVSADRAFETVPGLRWLNPARPDLEGHLLLGRHGGEGGSPG